MKSRLTPLLVVGAALQGCAGGGPGPAPTPSTLPEVDLVTTSGAIAAANLDHQVDALEQVYADRPSAEAAAAVVAVRLVRTRFFGRYSDLDRVEALAEAHPEASALRAQVQAALHHFADAERSLADSGEGSLADFAALAVATGRHADVLGPLAVEASARGDYRTHLLAGAANTAAGQFEAADAHFVAAQQAYRDVSPFPVAAARFQRGLMWSEVAGDAAAGRHMYTRALAALPQYVTGQVHLAELEWSEGDAAAAARRLQVILLETEDPEPFGLLGEILLEQGEVEAADALIAEAARRYDGLLERHPEAFWDHASEFFRGPGANPTLALALAEKNLANRPTERAYLLTIEAAKAAGERVRACELKAELQGRALVTVELLEVLSALDCG